VKPICHAADIEMMGAPFCNVRAAEAGTFKPESKRWVIERTFAWFGRNRRLAKDFEATITSAEAWFLIASVRLLSRRLARA
jgi:putative transposase